jgi:hypothetical protein
MLSSLPADQKKGVDEGISAFEKETGLTIAGDLVPGLRGDLTLAVYPGKEADSGIPDGLIALDDANAADPAAMVEKIKAVIATECKKNNTKPPIYHSENRGGAVVWTIDGATTKDLQSAIGLKADKTTEPKELLFATIGKSVVITSSQSMMNRTIASFTSGKSGLDTDPAYAPMLKRVTDGAQNVFILDLPGVMQRMKSTISDACADPQGPKAEDVLALFGKSGNGIVFSQGISGQTVTGTLFLPLNYEAAVKVISQATAQSSKNQQGMGNMPGMGTAPPPNFRNN